MKAAKTSSLEDAVARLLDRFSPGHGKKLSGEQLVKWAEQARECMVGFQRRILEEGSSIVTIQKPSVDNLSSLGSKMVKNAAKLEEITTACRLAFTRWQKEEQDREKTKLKLLRQIETTLRTCFDKLTPQTSTLGLIRPLASTRKIFL